jgi:hypothetical protein
MVGTFAAASASDDGHTLSFGDIAQRPIEQLRLSIDQVNWFSTYRVHHRVASRFRVGRAFLLGDAAHVHSPVGAQGMNTGIGDAANLGWKLAAVLADGANVSLLDSYEAERIPFARRLVATTDRAFAIATKRGTFAAFVRTKLFPSIVSIVFRSNAARRYLFRAVSQIAIAYRNGPLSTGRAGSVRAGDRLPWIPPDSVEHGDNYAPLASIHWQVHVYGAAPPELAAACSSLGIALHVFTWRRAMRRAGLARDALYLIRPGGYVGLADAACRPASLRQYLSAHLSASSG